MSATEAAKTKFIDWLRGFLDGVGDADLTSAQKKRIADELAKLDAPTITITHVPATTLEEIVKRMRTDQPYTPQPYQPYVHPTTVPMPYVEPVFPPWLDGTHITCAAPPNFQAFTVEFGAKHTAAQPLDPHGPTWTVPYDRNPGVTP